MKRLNQNNPHNYFHVSGYCPYPAWPSESVSDVWSDFNDTLADFEDDHVKTHAFVLLPDHYEWICSMPEDADVSGTLSWFQECVGFVTLHSGAKSEFRDSAMEPQSFFIGPPNYTQLNSLDNYRQAYCYTYGSPTENKLVAKPQHYPYSTMPYVLGLMEDNLGFTCWDNMGLISHPQAVFDEIELYWMMYHKHTMGSDEPTN